jgi:hypothetical protein
MEPSELYQKSLCKYRNELTLSSMFVSEGVMSSSPTFSRWFIPPLFGRFRRFGDKINALDGGLMFP